MEYSIKVDPEIAPVVHPCWQVTVALKDKFKNELNSLVKMGITTPVRRTTSCINSFACFTKANGSIRLCLNPRDLNKNILQLHFVTPTFEDVVSKLHSAK